MNADVRRFYDPIFIICVHRRASAVSNSLLICLLVMGSMGAAKPSTRPADPVLPGDEMIHAYLARRAIQLDGRFDDLLPDPAHWETERTRLRQEFLYMLGLSPLPERTPLQATVTGSLEREGITVERLHFQSRPHLYVTANLYRPTRIPAGRKLPAVLYVCGHGYRGPEGVKAGYQAHGIWFARHGYIALLIDTLERGEIPGVHRGLYSEGRRWWHSRGYTPAGVECWNGMRAIDYLLSRADVDAARIAVTGISGGGAYTMWIEAADERVKVAVSVSGMADLEAYVADQKTDVHCDCMFVYNVYGWPWTRIAALIAPRPMLLVNSDQDRFFPLDANQRVSNRLERLYGRLEAGDLMDSVMSTGEHAYRRDIRQAIYRFINTHLKGDWSVVLDSEEDLVVDREGQQTFPIEPKMLRVFAEGALPADRINTKIDQNFVPMAAVPPPARGEFEPWKQKLIKELRRVSFAALPETIPPAEPASTHAPGTDRFTSEPGIEFQLRRQSETEPSPGGRILLVVSLDDEARVIATSDPPRHAVSVTGMLIRDARSGDSIYVCQPRGIAATRWGRKAPPNRVERSFALVGSTVDTGRVRDVAAAAGYLRARFPQCELMSVGRGAAGILAAYAALLEPSIQSVRVVEPFSTHMDPAAPQFLNVLRVCDIPEMLGMLAPRPLTLTDAPEDLRARVRAIYAAAGAAEKLTIDSPR